MTVGIIPNSGKDAAYTYTREVFAWLTAQGVNPVLTREDAIRAALSQAALSQAARPEDALYREADFLVVLGGDGTMLRVSHQAAFHDTPMLGVNLGHLGYLTDVEQPDGFEALRHVLRGECKEEKRMMLEMVGGPSATDSFNETERLALNEVCVARGALGKLITIALYINGEYMDTLRADGVIIATPTGSTAYNLSAGGPILTPHGEMIAITAVCPHALYTRPWVIAANDSVDIELLETQAGAATVSLDGVPLLKLKPNERITVQKSRHIATILKTSSLGFYEVLRRKMIL